MTQVSLTGASLPFAPPDAHKAFDAAGFGKSTSADFADLLVDHAPSRAQVTDAPKKPVTAQSPVQGDKKPIESKPHELHPADLAHSNDPDQAPVQPIDQPQDKLTDQDVSSSDTAPTGENVNGAPEDAHPSQASDASTVNPQAGSETKSEQADGSVAAKRQLQTRTSQLELTLRYAGDGRVNLPVDGTNGALNADAAEQPLPADAIEKSTQPETALATQHVRQTTHSAESSYAALRGALTEQIADADTLAGEAESDASFGKHKGDANSDSPDTFASPRGAPPVGGLSRADAVFQVERLVDTGASAPKVSSVGTSTQSSSASSGSVDGRLVAQTVTKGLSAALQQRDGDVTLRLSPPTLGLVRIKMTLDHGSVGVRLETTNATAQSLLSEQLPALRTSLEARGLTVDRIAVHHSSVVATPATSPNHQSGANDQSASQQDTTARQDHDAGGAPSQGRRDQDALAQQENQIGQELDDGVDHNDSTFATAVRLKLDTIA